MLIIKYMNIGYCFSVSYQCSEVSAVFSELLYGGVPGQTAVVYNAVAEVTG